jgi:hypothetical protein
MPACLLINLDQQDHMRQPACLYETVLYMKGEQGASKLLLLSAAVSSKLAAV